MSLPSGPFPGLARGGVSSGQLCNKVSNKQRLCCPSPGYYSSDRQRQGKLRNLNVGGLAGRREGRQSPAATPPSALTSALALALGSYQGSSPLSSQPSTHPCLLPADLPATHSSSRTTTHSPPGTWIMSVGELENRRLICFVSLVSAHQHQLPVVSEGAALGPASSPWPD